MNIIEYGMINEGKMTPDGNMIDTDSVKLDIETHTTKEYADTDSVKLNTREAEGIVDFDTYSIFQELGKTYCVFDFNNNDVKGYTEEDVPTEYNGKRIDYYVVLDHDGDNQMAYRDSLKKFMNGRYGLDVRCFVYEDWDEFWKYLYLMDKEWEN